MCLALVAGCGDKQDPVEPAVESPEIQDPVEPATELSEKQDPVEPATESPEITHTSKDMPLTDSNKTYQTAGFMLGSNLGISLYSKEEVADLIKGLEAAQAGEQPEFLAEYVQKANIVVQQKSQQAQMEARQAAEAANAPIAEENIAAGEKFLATLEGKEGIQKTDSGLYYEIIKEGTGPKASSIEDKVTVHYEGKLISGQVFDSSKERGQPATFPLNGVIKGFQEGLQLVGEGGEIRLYVPSKLGYGNNQAGELIKPGSLLIFDVELIKVNP